jgi:hypothetical protein
MENRYFIDPDESRNFMIIIRTRFFRDGYPNGSRRKRSTTYVVIKIR